MDQTVIIRELHRQCSIASAEDLAEHQICYICHDPFTSNGYLELALKLSCGHVFGNACLRQHLASGPLKHKNKCPLCKKPILKQFEAQREELETELDLLDSWRTAENDSGVPPNINPNHVAFVKKAEQLFQNLCEYLMQVCELLNRYPDTPDSAIIASRSFRKILRGITEILSCVTVKDFLQRQYRAIYIGEGSDNVVFRLLYEHLWDCSALVGELSEIPHDAWPPPDSAAHERVANRFKTIEAVHANMRRKLQGHVERSESCDELDG